MGLFNVAAVQIASGSTNPDLLARKAEEWDRMEHYLDLIVGMYPTVDLVVFPELFVPGVDVQNFQALAESIPGPTSERACAKARSLGKWVVPGTLLELGEDGRIYNVALLISPEGEIALKYRKTCIPYPLEPSALGRDLPIFEIPGVGRVGLMICADGHWPEVARTLALKGAELIIKPTLQPHWIGGPRNHDDFAVVRASENQLCLISVNQPSPIGMGRTMAVDPEGRVLDQLGDSESFCVVPVDFDAVRRVREHGSFGMYCFLKMLKEFVEAGVPLDEIYREGIATAPVYSTLKYPAPKTPSEIRRWEASGET